jgi:hypothetical protein
MITDAIERSRHDSKAMMSELEDLGIDSLTILKMVMKQFPDLFGKKKDKSKSPLSRVIERKPSTYS